MGLAKDNNEPGTLVISLDFELYWGVREAIPLENFRSKLSGTYQAVPEILNLFEQYGVAATWAIVGFLYYQSFAELRQNIPQHLPSYPNSHLSPYPYIEKAQALEEELYFCPKLVELISKSPHQEIATHTFSHYYCLEPGQTQSQFQADLESAIAVANSCGQETRSIVFPRNQYNQAYLAILKKLGITSYRGNEPSPLYNSYKGDGNRPTKRLLRLIDSYLNIDGHHCYSLEGSGKEIPVNIPSSRFLRPHSAKLKYFDSLRLKRITSGLDYAAAKGLIYHLWWHPHNFGDDLTENLQFLNKVLDHYQMLADQGKMRSLNMGQLAELWLNSDTVNKSIPEDLVS